MTSLWQEAEKLQHGTFCAVRDNYPCSCGLEQFRNKLPVFDDRPALDALVEEAKRLNSWLGDVAASDMDEIVADGGITAAMVIGQEADERQKRLRAALQVVFDVRCGRC